MSEKVKEFVEIPQQFLRDGNQVCFVADLVILDADRLQFITRCTKPSQKGEFVSKHIAIRALPIDPLLEFVQICKAVAIGFAVMGFIGYFVKLIHIPM